MTNEKTGDGQKRDGDGTTDGGGTVAYLHFLYLGDVDTEGAVIWTGWAIASAEKAHTKALGIAYEGKCAVTVVAVPRAPVVSKDVACVVSTVTFEQARAHFNRRTLETPSALVGAHKRSAALGGTHKEVLPPGGTHKEALCPS